MVPCAYLRAFEPLDAFPASARARWGGYVSAGAGMTTGQAIDVEARTAASRVLTGREIPHDEALVRRVGSRIHVCPLELELRSAVAAVAFRELVPAEVVDTFIPPAEARRALEAVHRAERPPHIREATWVVPLHWFALFDPTERHHVDPPEGRGPRLTYLTSAAAALDRLEHVVDVVDRRIQEAEPLLALLADLMDWGEQFSPDSIFELDYGGLTALVPAPLLAEDHSCGDLWQAVNALDDADPLGAAAYYGALRARWSRLRTKASAN